MPKKPSPKKRHPKGRKDVWWIEEEDGIKVIMECTMGGPIANIAKLKWAELEAILKRRETNG